MTVRELIDSNIFQTMNAGKDLDKEVTKPFCCDLLSIAMGKATEGAAWVTVMGNMNTLAVATLTEVACIILAEGAVLDEAAQNKAREQDITILYTKEPIFDAALKIHQLLNDSIKL